jgi:hypothetical protein
MKDALILQGKKFISAKRAAIIFGYTSDYVGQLCREGRIECTMVGRSWFVSEDSVLKHKASSLDVKNANSFASSLPSVDKVDSRRTDVAPILTSSITLKDLVDSSVDIRSMVGSSSVERNIKLPVSVMETGITSDAKIPKIDSKGLVNSIGSIEGVVDKNIPSQINNINNSSSGEVRVSRRFSKADLSLVLILLLLSVILFGRNFISYFPYSSKNIVATVLNGVVVAPSASTSIENESMKNDLRNPFSDEVNVLPDSSGTAGVIVPVFKESKGDDFLYVMVPVKETKKDENK